jgi:hypothetical protein
VRQPLRERDRAVLSPEPEQVFRAQTDRGDDGAHFLGRISMERLRLTRIPSVHAGLSENRVFESLSLRQQV